MREIPPLMVLVEETPTHVLFRYRKGPWALFTGVLGMALAGLAARLYRQGGASRVGLAVIGLFGLLLLFSTVYSLTATQWLRVDGVRRTVRFYQKNLYGLRSWERTAADFRELRVLRYRRQSNWTLVLIDRDGGQLFLGTNAFGTFSQSSALGLADKVASRTGIRVEAQA